MKLQRVMFEESYPRVPAGRCERQAFVSGTDDGVPVSLEIIGEIITYAYDGHIVWQCHHSKARFWEPAYSDAGEPAKTTHEADGSAPVDTDAAQVSAFGAAVLAPWVPATDYSQPTAAETVAEQVAAEAAAETVTPIAYAAANDAERLPASDAFEVLSDAVGVPMRRVESDVDKIEQNVNTEVDETPSLEPRVKPVDSVKLSRKERRRSRR